MAKHTQKISCLLQWIVEVKEKSPKKKGTVPQTPDTQSQEEE
jgi:hypothetical protein